MGGGGTALSEAAGNGAATAAEGEGPGTALVPMTMRWEMAPWGQGWGCGSLGLSPGALGGFLPRRLWACIWVTQAFSAAFSSLAGQSFCSEDAVLAQAPAPGSQARAVSLSPLTAVTCLTLSVV